MAHSIYEKDVFQCNDKALMRYRSLLLGPIEGFRFYCFCYIKTNLVAIIEIIYNTLATIRFYLFD